MNHTDHFFAHWLGRAAEAITAYLLDKRERLVRRRNMTRVAIVVLGMASLMVFGQSPPPAPSPPPATKTSGVYPFTVESTIASISSKVMEKVTALSNNDKLKTAGQLITAFFLVAMMVWTSLKTMAGAKGLGELIGEWVPIFVGFGVVTLFLDKAAGGLIVSTMDSIGAAIGGSSMATLESALTTGAKPIFEAIAAIVNQPRATEGANVIGDGIMGWLATMMASAGSFIMGAIAKVVAAFVLVLAGVICMAHIIMAFISIQLVLALAPVMVPFLMFKPMEWLFTSWLKFLLGACMLKIVVAFLLQIASGLLTGMHELARWQYRESFTVTAQETIVVDILMLGMMMVFALLATLLLHQAPGIAAGLLSGSAGNTGFSGIKAVTGGAAGRVTAAGGSGAASAVQGAASRTAYGARIAHAKARGSLDRAQGKESGFASSNKNVQAAYQRSKAGPPAPAAAGARTP